MRAYLQAHWHGRQSLKQALILNSILPLFLLLAVQHYSLEPLTLTKPGFRVPLLITMAVLYAAVITTALVSVNRKTRIQSSLTYSAGYHVMLGNSILFMAACIVVVNLIDINTRGITTKTTIKQAFPAIQLTADNTVPGLHYLRGEITPSSPRLLLEYLKKHPHLQTLALHSHGGNIFAARAMASAILTTDINTHVSGECFSACTLVYIGGKSRTASPNAKFGFHGYRYRLSDPDLYGAVSDQERKDAELFSSQGVSRVFIDKMFDTRPPQLWKPALVELQKVRFLHAISTLGIHRE